MGFVDNIKHTLQQQSKLTILIIINIAVFLTVNLGINLAHVALTPYLGLPISAHEFIFKFWTIFSYMFTHENLMHVLYNLILLFFSGQIFYSILGEKRLIYVYVMSGIFGGVLFLLLGLIMPETFSGHYLIGASASVLGILMVVAVYAPDLKVNLFFVLEISFKYFALIVFLLSTVIDFAVNTGGKISHIGGAVFGLIYAYNLKSGRDFLNIDFLNKSKKKLKIVHRSHETPTKSMQSEDNQLNMLLEKISKSGYDSLTKKEKEELFKLSQKK